MAKVQKKQIPDEQSSLENDLAATLLLKEADEELRQEKLNALWAEWGSTIIGIGLMIIFGTMMGVGWNSWRHSAQSQQTQILLSAPTSYQKTELSGSYEGIAAMLQAAQLSEGGADFAPIINEKLAIAADAGLPREWDILAEWGAYRTKADSLDSTDELIVIANDMVGLAEKRNNPFTPMILIEAAVLYGENGDTDEALSVLKQASQDEKSQNNPSLLTQIENLTSLYTNGASNK